MSRVFVRVILCIYLCFSSACYAVSLQAPELEQNRGSTVAAVLPVTADKVGYKLEEAETLIKNGSNNHNVFLKHKSTQSAGLPSSYYFEVFTALVVILLLIVLAAWLTRRLNIPINSAAGKIKINANIAVGAKEKLLVVTVENRKLLIGVGGGNISLIERLGLEDEKEEVVPDKEGFSGKLQSMLRSVSNV